MATHCKNAWAVFSLTILCLFVAPSSQTYDEKYFDKTEFLDSFAQWLRQVEASKGMGSVMADQKPFSGEWLEEPGWPKKDPSLGQIAGVSSDKQGNAVVLHRGSRPWEDDTFFENNTYSGKRGNTNPDPVVVTLSRETGEIIHSWGKSMFYMPHGLEIDHEGNYWVTDLALHQVIKVSPSMQVELVMGRAFEPAQDNDDIQRLCKPTDVAVASNGDFFVADGYCNSRIIKYNRDGQVIGVIGQGDMWVPHSLALVEEMDIICVADRENKRILCYKAGIQKPDELGIPDRIFSDEEILGRVFAITYCHHNGFLYAVCAPTGDLPGTGLTIDLRYDADEVIAAWGPKNGTFNLPHALGVTMDGKTLYVVEIEPHRVWKFNQEEPKVEEKVEDKEQ